MRENFTEEEVEKSNEKSWRGIGSTFMKFGHSERDGPLDSTCDSKFLSYFIIRNADGTLKQWLSFS